MISNGTVTLPNGKICAPGTPATLVVGSDCYPYQVIGWTKSGKTLWVQPMRSTPTVDHDGTYDGRQSYDYSTDPDAKIVPVTWRKNIGKYEERGSQTTRGCGFKIGTARKYSDPSF